MAPPYFGGGGYYSSQYSEYSAEYAGPPMNSPYDAYQENMQYAGASDGGGMDDQGGEQM